MSVGFVMLAHEALHRAAEVARVISDEGCPVVIHIDRRVPQNEFRVLADEISGDSRISLARRFACEWGTWSLVEASRTAAEQLLAANPDIGHVMLISGACLPIKPVAELMAFLADHPDTDFIESVTIEDVPWTKGGLSEERFTFSFPFAWKRQRALFDLWVAVQRRTRRRRRVPEGLEPHLGSQWWCLTRATLNRIFDDPGRADLDRYFRNVWIPDESYFQSLARYYGARVESRSLTLSRFDFQGKPHVFYDDHLALLTDNSAYFARKVWPGAGQLYDRFLSHRPQSSPGPARPASTFADGIFGEAVQQRTTGRAGLAMAGRFPREGFENGVTAAPYAVFHGFGDLFRAFPGWVHRQTGSRAHGNLFHPHRAVFADGKTSWTGALSDCAALRDYDPEAFLRNLVWNSRGEHQSFLTSARDNLAIGRMLPRDRNASVYAVTGAWALPLLHSGKDPEEVRRQAAMLQKAEADFIGGLRERRNLSNSRIWSLAEILESPAAALQDVLDDLTGAETRMVNELPVFRPLAGLPDFLQSLKNAGMNPYLAGDIDEVSLPQDEATSENVVRLR